MSASHLLPQHPMHVPFRSAPVTHAPSPFGFGFGLSNQPSTSHAAGHYGPASGAGHLQSFQTHHAHSNISQNQFASVVQSPSHARAAGASPARANTKRRHDETDIAESREDSNMSTRSPSPDRPRRTINKRRRATDTEREAAAKTAEAQDSQANVDVGVLLASLPPESLLPLLTSLITSQPSLKPLILSLIPQPSVGTAIQALNNSAKALRDAYPYAQSPQPPTSTSFGFGSSFGTSTSMHAPSSTSFGFRTAANSQTNGVMREDYVRNRIKPSVAEFISTATSYLSYFTLLPSPQNPDPQYSRQSLHDSFAYLCALTVHVMRAPPLARVLLLGDNVLQKILSEWNMWIDRLDVEVNQNGGMFSAEAVKEWERSLDELTKESPPHGQTGSMQPIRDKWIEKVGWMVGRTVPKDYGLSNMTEEEDEEL
ncbi:cut8 domain protein [Ceratobasidium sp. AG-Ba]|nr:cut8 domain protein [Ceratobasidium sp. AG-Ba]QRW14868.1 cut8 domain protein [Ceratobasidium sp. AG-Ba]